MKTSKHLASDSEDFGSDTEHPSCRICFEEDLPLIRLPCLCKGSLSLVHEKCLNDFINSKEKSRNMEDVDRKNRVNCEICKAPMDVETSYELKWEKLYNIKIEVYFILFGITCLGAFGLHIAGILLDMSAHQKNGLGEQIQYLVAYVWIIGVVLYVLFEPIFS